MHTVYRKRDKEDKIGWGCSDQKSGTECDVNHVECQKKFCGGEWKKQGYGGKALLSMTLNPEAINEKSARSAEVKF